MTNPGNNAYLRTRVMTATPAELRMMLLDGAVKYACQGREGMAKKDFEAMFNGISACRNIVVELMTSISDDVDRTLADRVRSLYTFLFTELTTASMEKSVPKMDKIIELLEYEAQTWRMLLEKLANERPVTTGVAGSLRGTVNGGFAGGLGESAALSA